MHSQKFQIHNKQTLLNQIDHLNKIIRFSNLLRIEEEKMPKDECLLQKTQFYDFNKLLDYFHYSQPGRISANDNLHDCKSAKKSEQIDNSHIFLLNNFLFFLENFPTRRFDVFSASYNLHFPLID